VSNHSVGHAAEKRAAEYLKSQGFKIKQLNWKTPSCEIDIVAEKSEQGKLWRKEKTIYFVEVKYRRTAKQGLGMDYVTPTKLKQMQLAAETWVSHHNWQGQYQLAVISIDANEVTFVDDILSV
jgi:putative endonuclease